MRTYPDACPASKAAIPRFSSKVLLLAALIAITFPTLRAEYYTFEGGNGVKVDGSDILYQETRYPFWAESTYNARWFPGIAGEKTSTALYSGPAYGGDGGTGVRETGYIWSFWGVDHPVNPGDSVVPVWWNARMNDVPSIGEGASGKVEGKWTMSTGAWYPGVLRIWRPTGNPENVSMAGQWIKDGVTGRWHHMATFRMPFVANRFTGDCGFIEDHSHGNRNPRRVEFRNYYFRKGGTWIPGKVFKPSTRQKTEKGSSGLIENGTAAYFETCSGADYKGNMGPGAQEVSLTLNLPEKPPLDPILVKKVEAAATGRQVLVKWSLEDRSSPQFSYRIDLFSGESCEGAPIRTVECIDPDASEVLIASEAPVKGVRVVLTDVFDQASSPARVLPFLPDPLDAKQAASTAPGLNYRYYQGSWEKLPDFDALNEEPVSSGAVNGPDLSIRRGSNAFACEYRGYLEVPEAGIWCFALRSSDGSRLVIDGEPVIDHDGIHGAGYVKTGACPLAAGKHEVVISCFKARQGSGEETQLELSWEGPGRTMERVPESAWSRVPAAGEPMVKLLSPAAAAPLAAGGSLLTAAVKAGGVSPQMVRFYQESTVCGVAYSAAGEKDALLFRSRELLGAGPHRFRARLIYGEKSEHSIDSPSVEHEIVNPRVTPWEFAAIGKHHFPAASSVVDGTHTLLGDGLNLNWQKITGDTTIVARIKRRPSNSWISQFDGGDVDGGWSGGVIFRQDLDAVPGSEMGRRFVALFASAGNSIHMQDHTNHNAGGLFWGENRQNPQGSYQWLKLKRTGARFEAFLSADGARWDLVESRDLSKEQLAETCYAGVFTLARPSTHTNPNRWQFADVAIGADPRVSPVRNEAPLYWPMNEGTGSGIANRGDESSVGVLQNGAAWVDGASGKGIRLNGTDQSVLIPPLGFNTNRVTICGWVKREGRQKDWSGIAMCRGTATTGLMVGPGDQLRFNWDSGKNASYNFDSKLLIPDGRWTFVAMVVEPAKATLYLKDGNELRSAECAGVFDVASFDSDFHLGFDPHGEERRFKGALDEFRVIPRALTPAEIKVLAEPR